MTTRPLASSPAPTPSSPSSRDDAGFLRITPLREERVERRLALAFGFMLFLPTVVMAGVIVSKVDPGIAMLCVVVSAFIGYFAIIRRMIQSILLLSKKAQEVTSGRLTGRVKVNEGSEIGELARAFNRITQELEQKVEQLESSRQLAKSLLTRIGTALISYEGIDAILILIVEHTAAALEAQMGSLLLVDGDTQELYAKTVWLREAEAMTGGMRIKLGEGIVGWVAREGRALRNVGAPAAIGISNGAAPRQEGAVLCVPLKLRDRTIGVMAVLREDASRAFTEDDESLMTNISSQMAVAIENYQLNLSIERTYLETIMALALAVEAKDPYSAGHSKRVGFYATKIGEQMGLEKDMLRVLNDAGVLHDIGKIGIKDEILLKAVPLTPEESKIMAQHAVIGEAIVKPVRSLQKVVVLVRHHHERFDGGGYPDGLTGEAIPLGARILSVADTYDAMVTDRPYRKRLPVEQAKTELRAQAGVTYDPAVVEAFIRFLDEKDQRLASSRATAD